MKRLIILTVLFAITYSGLSFAVTARQIKSINNSTSNAGDVFVATGTMSGNTEDGQWESVDTALTSSSAFTGLQTTVGNQGVLINGLQSNVTTLNGQVSTINGTLTSQANSINTLNTGLATTNANVAGLTTTVNNNSSSIVALNNAVSGNTTSINVLNGEVSTNTSSIGVLNGQVATNTVNIASNTSNINTLNGQVSTNTANISSLDTVVNNQGTVLTNDTTAIANQQTQLNTQQGEINGLNNRVSSLERTQDLVTGKVRIFDTRKWEGDVFVSYDGTRNTVSQAGVEFTFKLGESYSDRRIDELNKKLDEVLGNKNTKQSQKVSNIQVYHVTNGVGMKENF